MVLESILNPVKAEKKPIKMLFMGFIYATVAAFLSLWIFFDQSSLVMVFLTVVAAIPLMYKTVRYEESKDLILTKESALLREHNRAIVMFMFLFLGITLASALWYVVLPSETTGKLFEMQVSTIRAINSNISGNFLHSSIFTKILVNNLKVLFFAIIFSFVYGAGAIFILTWNSTVIGTAIGNFIRTNISDYASSVGLAKVGGYFHIVSLGLLRYAIHGIPEIMAYFYGGLAGGILSAAIIKKHYRKNFFEHILTDFFELLLLAVSFIILAAFLEVYVTPCIFGDVCKNLL